MIGIVRVVEIGLVAADTTGRESFIDATRMTLLTRCIRVRPGQWERSCCMVKFRAVPSGRRVTRLTCRRESGRGVIRILRIIEVVLMTAYAIG